jgi:signal peptidase I
MPHEPCSSDASGIRLGWIPVRGDSMWPALRSGDAAGYVRLEGAPAVGSVLVARIGGALCAHRVESVSAGGGLITLRGDNSARQDPPVSADQVLGVVRSVRRANRELTAWDVGPSAVGLARVAVKRVVARLLRRAS